MQFEDVRVLLSLPYKGSHIGGNFATAALLFNFISGASVCFYALFADSGQVSAANQVAQKLGFRCATALQPNASTRNDTKRHENGV